MTRLGEIQELAQQIADAISTAVKLETEIVDETMMVIAGTGKSRKRVNTKEEGGVKEAGFLYGRVLTMNQAFIVEDARNEPFYDPASLAGQTEEIAEICCPIRYGKEAVGVIGLLAFTADQHQHLLDNKHHMLEFLERMSELFTSKLAEMELTKQWQLTTKKLNTLIESIHEGILAIDEQGIISHCNRTAEILIKKSKQELIGQTIESIWEGSPMLSVLKHKQGYVEKEEIYRTANQYMHFLVTATPIQDKNKSIGVVASFRPISDVRKLAYSITNNQKMLSFAEIKGESKALEMMKGQAQQVSQGSSNILITGESGTGKGLFALAIHDASPRRTGPFIAVNCGAIPETLLESELFGYAQGAFTGANKEGKSGKFELADGGTIFLDEIGDMPLHLQVKLLHVLQNKEIERVGGRHIIPVNVRVIAATNKNLEKMVAEGEFRSDLYFRLNVIPLHLPPLRQRREDIPFLIKHFLEKHSNTLGKNIFHFEEEVIQLFINYSWPGNVRELENAVEYAVNMERKQSIHISSLPQRILDHQEENTTGPTLKERIRSYEKRILQEMLSKYGQSVKGKKKMAKELQISLATLYRKLEEHSFLKSENYFSNTRNNNG